MPDERCLKFCYRRVISTRAEFYGSWPGVIRVFWGWRQALDPDSFALTDHDSMRLTPSFHLILSGPSWPDICDEFPPPLSQNRFSSAVDARLFLRLGENLAYSHSC